MLFCCCRFRVWDHTNREYAEDQRERCAKGEEQQEVGCVPWEKHMRDGGEEKRGQAETRSY